MVIKKYLDSKSQKLGKLIFRETGQQRKLKPSNRNSFKLLPQNTELTDLYMSAHNVLFPLIILTGMSSS